VVGIREAADPSAGDEKIFDPYFLPATAVTDTAVNLAHFYKFRRCNYSMLKYRFNESFIDHTKLCR